MYRDFSIFNCLVQFSFAFVSVSALALVFQLAMFRQAHIAVGFWRRCRCNVLIASASAGALAGSTINPLSQSLSISGTRLR
jgi:hypothetical protein